MLEKFSKKSKLVVGAATLAAAVGVGGNEIKNFREQNLAGEQLYYALQSPDVARRTVSNIEGELNRSVRAGGKLELDSAKKLTFREGGIAESDWNKSSANYILTDVARKFNYSFNGMKVSLDKPVTSMSERTAELGLAVSALDKQAGDAGSQKIIKSVFQVDVPSKTLLSASKGDKPALVAISRLVYEKIGVKKDMTVQDSERLQSQLQSVIKERIAAEAVK